MAWQNFHGAYDNTGPYANVVLGGNPGDTADFGFPLAIAHSKGYGKGINFSDDGNYFFASLASINGCEVESTICYNDCGQNLVFRDFRILLVLGQQREKLPQDKQELWWKLVKEADLGEFNGCDKNHYTPENMKIFMERLDKLTKDLVIALHQ